MAGRVRRQSCVVDRLPAGCHRELAEAIKPPDCPRVHVRRRIEVVDLAGYLRAEGRRVEAIDAANRRAAGSEGGPKRVDTDARGRHDADARDPDLALAHTELFVPVASPDSRCPSAAAPLAGTSRSAARASAMALNVASVRPAMGRANRRSTTIANTRRRGG